MHPTSWSMWPQPGTSEPSTDCFWVTWQPNWGHTNLPLKYYLISNSEHHFLCLSSKQLISSLKCFLFFNIPVILVYFSCFHTFHTFHVSAQWTENSAQLFWWYMILKMTIAVKKNNSIHLFSCRTEYCSGKHKILTRGGFEN